MSRSAASRMIARVTVLSVRGRRGERGRPVAAGILGRSDIAFPINVRYWHVARCLGLLLIRQTAVLGIEPRDQWPKVTKILATRSTTLSCRNGRPQRPAPAPS